MWRWPLALSPPGPRGHPATPYLARQRPSPKLFEPDLSRRGSGGSDGTVYLRWAHAAMVGMIARTMRRAFSRGCLACREPMTRPMLSRIGRNATKETTARSKAVRPMKQTRAMTIPVASENPIRPTNTFQSGCRCRPLVERDCQEASRLSQMTEPVLCS